MDGILVDGDLLHKDNRYFHTFQKYSGVSVTVEQFRREVRFKLDCDLAWLPLVTMFCKLASALHPVGFLTEY